MAEVRDLPVLPLRGTVVFPGPTVAIAVGRPATLRAIEAAAQRDDKLVFVVAQREGTAEVESEGLYSMGVVAKIVQIQRGLGGIQLLIAGDHRGTSLGYRDEDGVLHASVRPVEQHRPVYENDAAFSALYSEVRERALELGKLRDLPEEVLKQVFAAVTDAGEFCDFVAAYTDLPTQKRQELLETLSVEDRLRRVLLHLQRQIERHKARQDIQSQVQEELGERQREVYLREQMKAIQKELGEDDQSLELQELKEKLEKLELPKEARAEVERELGRLERSGRESMEAQVIRTYLEWIAELPWGARSEDRLDLDNAAKVLDEDHYGLSDVKDRVLEYLAVRQLKARQQQSETTVDDEAERARLKSQAMGRGPILLFVGPPGVGKTSIAKSIARSLGREYVRASLGGVRDEADIRGHRRTYVGAMPGRIVQGLKEAKTKNPVFLLDEVDKLGVSFQGDPASALLEVLDPAQNDTFTDHYLGVPFDLSEVLFVCTANVLHTIPAPLRDRMEVVEFSGYTEREKAEIARRYLIPRQLEESGLSGQDLSLDWSDEAISAIVSRYTRESGVRQLERQVAAVLRKLARRLASGQRVYERVTADVVRELLGRPKVHPERAAELDEVGAATAMYYTPAGGDIMFVEAAVRRLYGTERARGSVEEPVQGWGNVSLILTGQLGDVMKESARAALSYAALHASSLQIPEDRLGSIEAHIHVPAGAVPKDGPSAGLTMATALISAMSGRPVRKDVAMTGEITLRGRVLPIGGVKEKVLGAHRAGIRHVVLPKQNEADLEDIPDEVREELEFYFVGHLDEALEVALLPSPRGEAEPAAREDLGARDGKVGNGHGSQERAHREQSSQDALG